MKTAKKQLPIANDQLFFTIIIYGGEIFLNSKHTKMQNHALSKDKVITICLKKNKIHLSDIWAAGFSDKQLIPITQVGRVCHLCWSY